MTASTPADLADLAEALLITEERTQQLDLDRTRLNVSYTLTLHRDATSAADVRAMLDHLAAAGMPETATLDVRADPPTRHTRMWAKWTVEVPR